MSRLVNTSATLRRKATSVELREVPTVSDIQQSESQQALIVTEPEEERRTETSQAVVPAYDDRAIAKAENSTRVSNWMIALGVGVAVAAVTTATVYYVKQRRRKELTSARYLGEEDQEESVESYSEKAQKYWNFTVKTFSSVRSVVSDFLMKKPNVSPMVSSEQARQGLTGSPFDSQDEILLERDL